MHGLWNGLAVLAGSRVIFQFESLTDRQQTLAVIGVMAPLAIATLTLLYLVARRAYRESPEAGRLGGTSHDAGAAANLRALSRKSCDRTDLKGTLSG
ncbi:MAG: hypothetical protein IH959_02020 [Chloroflexi bacterium]|nr:hypothetical protein [Chloroflexota bacterium]